MRFPFIECPFNSVKSDESNKHQEIFEDRGLGTIKEGYLSLKELSRIANYFLYGNSSFSSCSCSKFLLSHFCLMRGESVKRLELAYMFILDLENEGPTECKAMIVIME